MNTMQNDRNFFMRCQKLFYLALVLCFVVVFSQSTVAEIAKKTTDITPELAKQLKQAYKNKGDDYQPRTEHLNEDGSPVYINRLILEESPYLIQHAHNPVNWYPWSQEAFAKARRENKPIFLSIGYSTCHWCHVMERESFDNKIIAQYLNDHFVSIKVDRERRPDVDKVYMTALMMVKGNGGWPMSSLLTPEGSPFLSDTYLPPETFIQILQRATELWQDEEVKVRQIADKITEAVQSRQRGLQLAEHIGKERVQIAVITLLNRFDELQGGFSYAPKFPNETYLFLLLDMVIREQDMEVLSALKLSMNMMAQGGIYDQIGGGFHRYSTDNEWLTPHFEKMLYNQAHLARNYLQLFAITRDTFYKRIVTQTLDYVLRDMTSTEGGFYSASDADSEGVEGKFFLWELDEVKSSLPKQQAKLAIELYGISKEGNFNELPLNDNQISETQGYNILYLPESLHDFSQSHQLTLAQLYNDIDQIRKTLYIERQKKIAPEIDKKIVTAWNGMMITALARAGQQLKNQNYINAAVQAAEYLWKHHVYDSGTGSQANNLIRIYRASLNGKASVKAIQGDYAYLSQAYLALYDVTKNIEWLHRSETIIKTMIRLFWDKEEGSFYMTEQPTSSMSEMTDQVVLFDRPKDITDGAIPSGNAVALEVLSQLYYRTGNDYYHVKAMALVASLSSAIKNSPSAFSYFLMAVNQLNFGEVGNIQYGGKSHVRIGQTDLSRKILDNNQKQITINFEITMDKGWHINSRYPLDKDLTATAITLDKKYSENWKVSRVEYPQGETVNLEFSDTPLSLYQDTINIKVVLESKSLRKDTKKINKKQPIPISIAYQTCSDKVCLAPEVKNFYFSY